MASSLDSLVGQNIMVVTTDGRCFHGTLKGFDQTINLILDAAHERVYSPEEGKVNRVSQTCFLRSLTSSFKMEFPLRCGIGPPRSLHYPRRLCHHHWRGWRRHWLQHRLHLDQSQPSAIHRSNVNRASPTITTHFHIFFEFKYHQYVTRI